MSVKTPRDEGLLNYIEASPSPFHAASESLAILVQNGAQVLPLDSPWVLEGNQLYAVRISSCSLFAFRMPSQTAQSFLVAAAHTDSPCLRIKTRSFSWVGDQLRAGTEPYGGVILSTWLDRTLSIVGSVSFQTPGSEEILQTPLTLSGTQATIPNLAIHLNRDINKGYEFNPQTQMHAVLGSNFPAEAKDQPWEWLVCRELASKGILIAPNDILTLDLVLVDSQKASFLGDSAIFNAARIDNLAGCHAVLTALYSAKPDQNRVQVACLFDHEEVGSRSASGADSVLLANFIERIWCASNSGGFEDRMIAIAKSFLLSIDVAHAQHPNFADKHDPDYAPRLGDGPALKFNANQRYATGSGGAARFLNTCRARNIPVQHFTNRADMSCGSTIGPALSALTGITAVDVGIPILAMHSIRETASSTDHLYMIEALRAFYEGV